MLNLFCCFKSKHKLIKLYANGKERIEHAIDIVSLIQDIQEIRTFLHARLTEKRDLFFLEHHHNNLIHIDDEDHPEGVSIVGKHKDGRKPINICVEQEHN